jgi:DnaK suppressor protein
MPAKKTAPKPSRGKKAVSRPAARKVAVRKPVERAKVVSHPRTKAAAAAPVRKAAATLPPTDSATEVPHLMRNAAETKAPSAAPHEPSAPTPATPAPRLPATHGGVDADDADTAEPGSLLAGPRNVQPYILKRGEQYMSKEQTEHFRQILLSWKRDLMEEVDRTVTHMKDEAANFPDPNDRATQEEEFSLELRTRDRERKLIRKIDDALKRIEDGSYGYCLETGEEIGIKRLEARPVATLSIEAQERRERRERQYGDRDDRYR